MGKIEFKAKKKRQKAQLQKIILGVVATAGVIGVMAIAPNAIQALAMLDGGLKRKKSPRYGIETAFTRLLEKGHLRIVKTANGKFVRLTPEGKHALARMVASSPDSRRHKRWDKRWRLVMYDIHDRKNRLKLLEILRAFGFLKLQNSVWIYPYDTEELVTLLKNDFKFGAQVLYAVVEHMEYDAPLREHFGLRQYS